MISCEKTESLLYYSIFNTAFFLLFELGTHVFISHWASQILKPAPLSVTGELSHLMYDKTEAGRDNSVISPRPQLEADLALQPQATTPRPVLFLPSMQRQKKKSWFETGDSHRVFQFSNFKE